MTSRERILPPIYDRKGNPHWTSVMSPPDDSLGVIAMVPDRIIPIIFVPGVMGSNLKGIGNANGTNWRLDSPGSMAKWATRDAVQRKAVLTPATMVVDDNGLIKKGTAQHDDELKRRGWGEVGAISYASFLVWLENALSDYHAPSGGLRDRLIGEAFGAIKGEAGLTKEEVALSYKYRFPVHACGYNWLDDNANSAIRLKTRIDEVIDRYKSEKKMCEKVIVVTHSMGGLVGRYCSELLGMSEKILGIVHGVMPAIGAAAVYRRFKAGTEGGMISAMILGNNAAEMTAVLSSAPGPMQLLPTREYGNRWLKIKDEKSEVAFPQSGDPYREIYTVRGKWWSMCDDQLINPLDTERDPKMKQAQLDMDWDEFANIVKMQVKSFHDLIKDKYHPNTHAFFGSSEEQRAYGTVVWTGRDDTANDVLMRGHRPADTVNAKQLDRNQIYRVRDVSAELGGVGRKKEQNQLYSISAPDEAGDGTVPHRSGVILKDNQNVKSLLQVNVGHEPAFNDSDMARRFTLRAIVQIAQKVKQTGLHYG